MDHSLAGRDSGRGDLSDPSVVLALDVVGTLIEPAEPVAVTYARFAADRQVNASVEAIASRLGPAMQQIWNPSQPKTDETTERERWRAYVGLVLPEAGDRADAIFALLWQYFASSQAWRWFADARQALVRLTEAGRIWGLASNFDTRLHRWAAEQPELRAASFVLTSADLGCLKASPEFYERLRSQVQAKVSESTGRRWCMIGDQPANDIHPARQAGWEAVWLRREGTSIPITDELADVLRLEDLSGL